MSGAQPLPVLVVRHVPWEGPHRIGAIVGERFALYERCVLAGDALPRVTDVSGAIFMGGPMNVDEIDRYPGLLVEREWLAAACAADLPLLGVCLGAQLIARALGSDVRRGSTPELGWLPIEVHAPEDPLLGALAPRATVLHWHGDVFDLPAGATLLASSAQTPVQAFRRGNAVGTLFHAEADAALVDLWLAEPVMAAEARSVLGEDYAEQLRAGAWAHAGELAAAAEAVYRAFADSLATPGRRRQAPPPE